jgi:hypothetical protein
MKNRKIKKEKISGIKGSDLESLESREGTVTTTLHKTSVFCMCLIYLYLYTSDQPAC